MSARNSRFQRGMGSGTGGGVYECRICHKRTRETGHGEGQLELCAFCLRRTYAENALADGDCTEAEYDERVAALRAEYGRED